MKRVRTTRAPSPGAASLNTDAACDALPHALTFFLSTSERRRVLRRLRELHPRREIALLIALGSRHDGE